jgi:twitching motility protein PilT
MSEVPPLSSVNWDSVAKDDSLSKPVETIVRRPTLSRPVLPVATPVMAEAPLDEALVDDAPVIAPAAGTLGIRTQEAGSDELPLNQLLRQMVDMKGSDLHLSVGSTPLIRVNGDIMPSPGHPEKITHDGLSKAIFRFLSEDQKETYADKWELDCSYTIPNFSRFRVNILKQKGVIGAVFRVITDDIKPLDSLGLPTTLYSFAALPRGLVLVTGPTGSGKSTTLASLIDHANRTRSGHIMTIEDPVEFVHSSQKCVVNQREVGTDTHSFAEALKHVLRQDPDIILVGELRDLETIHIALTAAETGHLVFATLHTQSAKDSVTRIIDVFPPEQQSQIKTQLASTLKGVVSQTLVKRADGNGRVPAVEIMVVNFAIANLIRNDGIHNIPQALSTSREEGMQSLHMHLADLVKSGIITRDAAVEVATDLKDLDQYLGSSKAGDFQPREQSGLAGASF